MAKARPCPICSKYFNPKFTGRVYQEVSICLDCFLKEQLKDKNRNTPKQDALQQEIKHNTR